MSEDVLEKWALYIEGAEEGLLEYPDECECINDLAAEVRVLRPLAEIGRAFLALPDRTEVWLNHDVPFSAAGVHPILGNQRLYYAVCAALGQTPYKSPK